jgi:hypothetical protein
LKVKINRKCPRYALDVGRFNFYGSRFAKHFHGKNQASDVLLPKQDSFYSGNRSILDPDPVARSQEGMWFNAQSTFNNSPYSFDF